MFNKILVALDNTELARKIFAEAIALSQQLGAQLMLLHVLTPIETNQFGGQPGGIGIEGFFPILNEQAVNQYMKDWQVYEQQGMATLQKYADSAREQGVTVEFSQNIGDPGHVICELARTWQADLILMGRSGKSGISEMLLGSSSNYVLHHAHCSVLAVQAFAPEKSKAEQQLQSSVST